MTHVEIVKEAINSLNRNKNAGLTILDIRADKEDGVDVKVTYPKPIIGGDAKKKWYGFTEDGFKPGKIDIEGYLGMEGFEVADALRETNPEVVAILRIAYYFWKRGKDEKAF